MLYVREWRFVEVSNPCPACGKTLSPEDIKRSVVVVCEGAAETEFVKHLYKKRGGTGIDFARHAGGKTGFGERLKSLGSNRAISQVKCMALIRDTDEDAAAALQEMVDQIGRDDVQAVKPYPIPDALGVRALGLGAAPDVVIQTLPSIGQIGTLETLLFPAFEVAHGGVAHAVRDFLSDTLSKPYPTQGQRSKAELSCMLACVCDKDPAAAVSALWQSKKNLLGLLDDPVFDDLADFLRGLVAA